MPSLLPTWLKLGLIARILPSDFANITGTRFSSPTPLITLSDLKELILPPNNLLALLKKRMLTMKNDGMKLTRSRGDLAPYN